MPAREPAFKRLAVDERRRTLLELGRDLFARQSYPELSMAAVARRAGISKALLYHYFPSKRAFFLATFEREGTELVELIAGLDADLPPAARLTEALDAFLRWVERNREGYGRFLQSANTNREVHEIAQQVRATTEATIVAALAPAATDRTPVLAAAVHGWLWFMDGVVEHWLERGELDREQVRGVLRPALEGAVRGAGVAMP